MKKILTASAFIFMSYTVVGQNRVGINTNIPQAMLHVKDSGVVFTGATSLPFTAGNPPISGAGTRMMWYPDRAAFRFGRVTGTHWDRDNSAVYSFAAGLNSIASGNFSISLGNSTVARAFSCLAIGSYNDSITGSNPNSGVDTDPAFIIGNGPNNSLRSNSFIVLQNGTTGLNIVNGIPQALLHLKALAPSFDMHIRLENASNTEYASIVYDGSMKFRTSAPGDQYEWRSSDNNTRMRLQDDGNLFIDGTLTPNSDARLKKDIQPLQNSLQKILSLRGYHYNWIDKASDTKLQTGVIAQEIEKQMPELVRQDEEGIRGVNYNGLVAYLIEAMKEQDKKIDSLEKEVTAIKELLLQKNSAR